MNQILTYKTSYFSDSYQILKNDLQIGKLYKAEWLGSKIDTALYEQKFKFISRGLLKPTISILNISTNTIVGTIRIQHLFDWHQNAILKLTNGAEYNWTCNNLFTNDWQWTDLRDNEIIVTSKEPLDIFKQKGTITFSDKIQDKELFITLGIHMRNVSKGKSHFPKILGLFISITLLAKLFA